MPSLYIVIFALMCVLVLRIRLVSTEADRVQPLFLFGRGFFCIESFLWLDNEGCISGFCNSEEVYRVALVRYGL